MIDKNMQFESIKKVVTDHIGSHPSLYATINERNIISARPIQITVGSTLCKGRSLISTDDEDAVFGSIEAVRVFVMTNIQKTLDDMGFSVSEYINQINDTLEIWTSYTQTEKEKQEVFKESNPELDDNIVRDDSFNSVPDFIMSDLI